MSGVIYYFKGQRCSGLLDKADRDLKFEDSTNTSDVHGGWYDATGDYGKHLGGLGFSTFFNMQPLPVADWSLFKAYLELDRRGDQNFQQYRRRLLDEAMYGADFLVRMHDGAGQGTLVSVSDSARSFGEEHHVRRDLLFQGATLFGSA